MKRSLVVGLTLLCVVILGIAIIDAGAKRPIDWSKTYNFRDKIPYGLYVFRKEVPHILGANRIYRDFGESAYSLISDLDSAADYNAAIIDVYEDIGYDKLDAAKILHYVRMGGEVFLSSAYFGEELLDTLGIQAETLDHSIFFPTDRNIRYSLGQDTTRIRFDKVTGFNIFSKLNAKTCTILGQLHARGRAIPNFVSISHGKGRLYLHTLPEAFTNYHLLQKEGYDYAAKCLQVIQNKNIMFSDYYYDWEDARTPLRVILTKPGFYQAWYLLLLGLLVLFIFKSKREQRAVKVIIPEPNLSKDFAKTIATLYYENGHPGNIIQKKIDYFLFSLRTNYQLDTQSLTDGKFIKLLSLKTTVAEEECKALFIYLESCRNRSDFTIDEVKIINSRIEEFKSKASLI